MALYKKVNGMLVNAEFADKENIKDYIRNAIKLKAPIEQVVKNVRKYGLSESETQRLIGEVMREG